MRLDEIDRWHPGMLGALIASQRERDSVPELLRVLTEQVRLLFRQQVVMAGGDDPGALELPRPGQKPAKKSNGLRAAFQQAAQHMGR